jgi:hypothetical protein
VGKKACIFPEKTYNVNPGERIGGESVTFYAIRCCAKRLGTED